MKQSWKKLNSGNIALLVMGAKIGSKVQEQILRTSELGGKILASPDIALNIGVPVVSILSGEDGDGVLTYPKSGLPKAVINGLVANTEEEVAVLGNKKVINIVVVEIDETTGTFEGQPTMEEVRGAIHYNTISAVQMASAAGKIVCTDANADDLKAVLDHVEENGGMTEEVYNAIAKYYFFKNQVAMRDWSRRITKAGINLNREAKVELVELGFLVSKTEEAVA